MLETKQIGKMKCKQGNICIVLWQTSNTVGKQSYCHRAQLLQRGCCPLSMTEFSNSPDDPLSLSPKHSLYTPIPESCLRQFGYTNCHLPSSLHTPFLLAYTLQILGFPFKSRPILSVLSIPGPSKGDLFSCLNWGIWLLMLNLSSHVASSIPWPIHWTSTWPIDSSSFAMTLLA